MHHRLSPLEYLVLQAVRDAQMDRHTPAVETAIAANVPTVNAQLIRGYLVRFESAGYLHTTRPKTEGWNACCTEQGQFVLRPSD